MADQALDLWPQIEAVSIQTPGTILKQQAALLGKHTKNLLEGSVDTRTYDGDFHHRFLIKAPTLDYTMELFGVAHDLNLYPVRIESTGPIGYDVARRLPIATQDEFVNWLKLVFNSADTKRILSTLMAQAE